MQSKKKPITMKKSSIYTLFIAFASVFLFTMCKTDKSSIESSSNKNENKGVAFNVKIDSSAVDFTSKVDLQYVSLPQLYRWIVVSKSLVKLDNNPTGYAVTDSVSWSHVDGKSFMSISHYNRLSEEITDYNLFYEKLKSSYAYNDYSYTKYNTEQGEMHEIKLSNDQTFNYKLIVPRENEIVSLDLMSYGDGYNEEIEKFVSQLPGLVRVHE